MDIISYAMGVKKGAESVPEVFRINGYVVDDDTLRITGTPDMDLSVYNRVQVVLEGFPASVNMRETDIVCAYFTTEKGQFTKYNHSGISNTPVSPTFSKTKIELPSIEDYTWVTASGKLYRCVCWAD